MKPSKAKPETLSGGHSCPVYPLYEQYKRDLRQVQSNNDYLLKVSGKSLIKQCKELQKRGFACGYDFYRLVRAGKRIPSPAFPYYFCEYWGLPLSVLMFDDLEAEALKKAELENVG